MLPTTNQTQQSSRTYPVASYPVASYPVATIQSQGSKPKAGRLLTTGTRLNPQNAAFQLIQTTSRCSLDCFEEKADIEGIEMSPSVSSVAGVSTSSFGLVGTTAFGLAKKTQLKLCHDTLATVHRTLSPSIADDRLLRIGVRVVDLDSYY
ncbi:hypothetical protein F511_22132 [Dorcoceras hygrometricum]|uniref:Uncharacterized protein n=1 Tax=Dorcoceras hygrometricum TaxID=472368 RepID=A0A2Z7B0G9_9LAMI|nr:hypothetical protein F511_22132 [Dorcoceras hygrometricum]